MRSLPFLLLLSAAALAQGLPPYPRPVRSVVAHPPDGGALVTFGQAVFPITCDLPDGGTCILDVQGRGGGNLLVEQQGTVEVTGIAGARVGVEGPVTATISGTLPSFATVQTMALENGTQVGLTNASLATLTATTGRGNCTYVDGDPTATISTTAANIPSSPMANRTAIEVFNHSAAPANYLLCSAQGTATTTSAVRIESGHQSRKWDGLGAGVLVSCRCATGTCAYNYQEEFCYQQ